MITPAGIPWYALVLNEPVLLAACVMLVLALIGLIAWLGARSSGGRPSWRMKALLIAPIAALFAGGAAHWLQTRVLADTHTASQWMLMPRDSSRAVGDLDDMELQRIAAAAIDLAHACAAGRKRERHTRSDTDEFAGREPGNLACHDRFAHSSAVSRDERG